LNSVLEGLKADRAALRAAVDAVAPELRERKPAPDRWSVAEVLEHLAIVEERIVGLLATMIPAAPLAGRDDGAGAAPTIDRARLRNRTARVQAPDPIQPTGTMTTEDAWQRLERSRARLLEVLDTAVGRDLTAIGRAHPVLGQLDGYQWIAAVGGHEERHAAQIRELAT
jgi:hypothetical protein